MDRLSEHLGIPPLGEPPDYYQLLGLPNSEPSPAEIVEAVQELSSRVRRDQHAFPEESQRLLNAIARAKLCLTNPAERQRHDAALRTVAELHESSVLQGSGPAEVAPEGAAPASVAAKLQGAGAPGEEEPGELSGGSWLIESGSPSAGAESRTDGAEWLVGSGSECDLRVRSSWVSRRHCLLRNRDGLTELLDLGSKNGTYINEVLIDEPTPVLPGDVVSLGKRVWLPWPWPAPGERLDARVLLIGRSRHNDLVLQEDSVSKHHAQLVDDGQTITLFDLNSRNGTRVGGVGERIGRVELLPHLPIFFGQAKMYGAELIDRCRAD